VSQTSDDDLVYIEVPIEGVLRVSDLAKKLHSFLMDIPLDEQSQDEITMLKETLGYWELQARQKIEENSR
jgi:hypothetical protein